MRIRFNEDCEVRKRGVVVQTFEAGEAYDLNGPSARHWLVRGKADPVTGPNPTQESAAGDAPDSGQEAPSFASAEAQASPEPISITSPSAGETGAESLVSEPSPSTTGSSSHLGPTSFTPPTSLGGERPKRTYRRRQSK